MSDPVEPAEEFAAEVYGSGDWEGDKADLVAAITARDVAMLERGKRELLDEITTRARELDERNAIPSGLISDSVCEMIEKYATPAKGGDL